MRNAREQLLRSCIKKLNKNVPKEIQVRFVVTYNTTKLNLFVNKEDPITKLASSFACCPGCYHDCTGKTERILWERINEHGYFDKVSMIYNHSTN